MKEMSPKAPYVQEYKEMKCIGKGNFGTAYLVQSVSTNKFYIAKKIPLDSLSDKEIEGAFGEVGPAP
jgi:NIMA (never in mitosis gene a)-related kinase